MVKRIKHFVPLAVALILVIACAWVLTVYVDPMKDVSMDLSLVVSDDNADPADFDNKGWTVYVQEGQTRTELTPDGFGGYTGLELGQTFYYSRSLEEPLDNPTLQIGTAERNYTVFLDDEVIYSDCPEMDNRIGYLHLPMSAEFREDPITITLPKDYRGKTLTVAQSTPEWSETGSVRAWPASVRLYCGYAYESGLISETTQTTLLASAMFAVAVILLISFARSRDWSILCLAVVGILSMVEQLQGTSFYHRYFDATGNTVSNVFPLLSAGALLVFLTLRGGRHRRFLWIPLGLYGVSVAVYTAALIGIPAAVMDDPNVLFWSFLVPYWLVLAIFAAILTVGTLVWRKENRFYRLFIPLAFAGVAVSWLVTAFFGQDPVLQMLSRSLSQGQAHYLVSHTLPGVAVSAVIAAICEAVKKELDRRTEKQLMEQRQELTMAGFENLRRQHEEVMMLRHDMLRHFRTLHDMGGDEKRTAYLAELIGQNQKIRPVVQSGNEMLDIILNGKLGAATDAGIRVELPRAEAPARLRLSDPDLCALVMNLVDNAITAASRTETPYIKLNIREKAGYLAIFCENSFDPQAATEAKKETVPKHGLGLKIIRNIVDKYQGVIQEDAKSEVFTVEIVIPLD